MKLFKKITGITVSAIMSLSVVTANEFISDKSQLTAAAADFTYPVQEFRIAVSDTNRNLNIYSSEEGSYLNSQTLCGTDNEKWYLNYINEGVYEIVSSETGYLITNENGFAVMKKDTDGENQRWKIEAVEQDFDGFDLYYKIVSNSDSSVGLTFNTNSNSVSVDKYTGNEFQKFRLDLDGLEGFAAASFVNGKMKAGTIGGLLGDTVYADTVSEFISALDSTEPKTVVVTSDLDLVNQGKDKQRIRDNKTIVGAYSGVTLYDSLLRNDDFWGEDDRPSNNIVIRNLNLTARTLNSTGSGVILLQFYGVRNLWIDHNSFSATFDQNKDAEVGKFIWINTPAANWSDGKYNTYNPDYITVSYNTLKNRYWTFAFGSQNKDTSRLHTSVMFNKFEQCSRRCPQYSNGFDHNYNNYHTVTGNSNPNKSSQVIGGEGSRVVNENCRFEGYTGNELDPDRNSSISFTESGSYTADSPSGSVSAVSFKNHSTSPFTPADCYGYSLAEAYNANGTDIKAFCNAYSGCFKSADKLKYITDSDMSSWVKTQYNCPFRSIEVGNDPVGTVKEAAEMNTDNVYTISNVGSGLYFDGSVQKNEETKFVLEESAEGYYRIYTEDKMSCLSVKDGIKDNGTSLTLGKSNDSESELFKFVRNDDGSFTIATKVTGDASCLGVAAGSKESNALVIQWECDGTDSQKWIVAAEGRLFKHLVVNDYENAKSWSINSELESGDLMYNDRTGEKEVTYSEIPDVLIGAEAITPACDSKNFTSDLAYFTAGADITVYAALDDRIAEIPAWLSEWKNTGVSFVNSKNTSFTLYSLDVMSGDVVTLGTNGQSSGCVNYTVFAVERIDETLVGDVNADGVFNMSDIVMMQKWLLAVPDTELTDSKAGDLSKDGVLNIFDLCFMKSELLKR